MARTELDDHLRTTAIKAGRHARVDGARAVDVRLDGGRVARVTFERAGRRHGALRGRAAGGWSSPTACARRWASCSGREWHRETVYGVAGRSYVDLRACPTTRGSARTSSCAARSGEILSGYGWIFPLGTGEVNLGVGTLATAKRPADVAIKPLMRFYADERREEFGLLRRAAGADLGAAADGRRGVATSPAPTGR